MTDQNNVIVSQEEYQKYINQQTKLENQRRAGLKNLKLAREKAASPESRKKSWETRRRNARIAKKRLQGIVQ